MKKYFLYSISFIIITVIILFELYKSLNYLYGIKIISKAEAMLIASDRKIIDDELAFYYKDYKLPHDKTEGFYLLAQPKGENYLGNISVDTNKNVRIIKPNLTKKELIETSTPIKIIIYDDKEYSEYDLYLSSLTVISIYTDELSKDAGETKDHISEMIAYDVYNANLKIKTHNAKYHVRGASSSKSEKKPYKVNITDKKGNSQMKSIAGLRQSDDWVLNPMYFDDSFMREKIAFEIWNNLSDKYNTHLAYVEVFMDDSYRGLYYLEEPIDEETTKTNEYDVVLSTIDQAAVNDPINISEFEVKQNHKYDEKEITYFLTDFKKYINSTYDNGQFEFDLINAAEYSVFLNATQAVDNTYKNQYIILKNIEASNKYVIYRTPWDLDWSASNPRTDGIYQKYGDVYEDYFVRDDIKNRKKYKKLTKEIYKKFSKDFYNKKNIENLLETYRQEITNSGAVRRNNKKWNTLDFEKNVQYLKDYYSDRIDYLDRYYGEE